MDFSALKTRTLAYLQDPDNKKWGNTILEAAVNFANSWAWKKYCLNTQGTHGLTSATATSIVADQQEYSLPSDRLRIWGIRRVNVTAPREPFWLDRLADPKDADRFWRSYGPQDTYPAMYYLLGSQFGIVPKPTESIADALQVYYFAQAATLSASDDTPELPSEFHDLIALRATVRMLRLDETEPSTVKFELNDGLAEMIHAISEGGEQGETSPLEIEY